MNKSYSVIRQVKAGMNAGLDEKEKKEVCYEK